MGIGIPFDLDASAVPLEQDLMDIPLGPGAQIGASVVELLAGDVVTQMQFVAKANVGDSYDEPTTILETITPTPGADGVVTPTTDPTVTLGTFLFSAQDSVSLAAFIRTYGVTATISRGLSTFTRVIQTGYIQALEGAFDVGNTLLDGTYLLDGEITLTGFPT
jgi:hypothetical protein